MLRFESRTCLIHKINESFGIDISQHNSQQSERFKEGKKVKVKYPLFLVRFASHVEKKQRKYVQKG